MGRPVQGQESRAPQKRRSRRRRNRPATQRGASTARPCASRKPLADPVGNTLNPQKEASKTMARPGSGRASVNSVRRWPHRDADLVREAGEDEWGPARQETRGAHPGRVCLRRRQGLSQTVREQPDFNLRRGWGPTPRGEGVTSSGETLNRTDHQGNAHETARRGAVSRGWRGSQLGTALGGRPAASDKGQRAQPVWLPD